MKLALHSAFLQTALLIVPFSLYFRAATIAHGGERSVLSRGPARLGCVHNRAALPQGSLEVYFTTDESDAWYFPRRLFAIYTMDGKLFRNVNGQDFAEDEIPEVVALPAGTYVLVARSEKDTLIRLPVVIRAGQGAIFDLNLREEGTLRLIARD